MNKFPPVQCSDAAQHSCQSDGVRYFFVLHFSFCIRSVNSAEFQSFTLFVVCGRRELVMSLPTI